MTPQWHVAKCLYKSVHSGAEPEHEQMAEQVFILLKSSDDQEANVKAFALAKSREHSYQNQYGATIEWKLESVSDVREIYCFELKDGLEIYSEYIISPQKTVDVA